MDACTVVQAVQHYFKCRICSEQDKQTDPLLTEEDEKLAAIARSFEEKYVSSTLLLLKLINYSLNANYYLIILGFKEK